MFAKHAWSIGALGLAVCACSDSGKMIAIADAPQVGAAIDAAAPAPDAQIFDAPVDPNLISNAGFEQGVAGWSNNGGSAVVERVTTVAQTGSASLLVTVRQGTWNGPAFDLTDIVKPGRKYAGRVAARLVNPADEKFSFSTRVTCSEDGQHFNVNTPQVPAEATDNLTWVTPTSTFSLPDPSTCTITNYLVYVETATGLEDFYIDDAVVLDITP